MDKKTQLALILIFIPLVVKLGEFIINKKDD